MLSGPNVDATVELARAVGVPVILSGGVSSLDDLAAAKVAGDGIIAGVICGRALYDGRIDVAEAVALLERPGSGRIRSRRGMLKVRIIPCLDVDRGRVVKGVRFVDLVDAGDPVEQARAYDAAGADELCFLDITASHENRDTIYDVVGRTAEQCFMPLTVGGGVRSLEDIRKLLLAGADKVSINTAAVDRPEFVAEAAEKFGNQCIVVAIDAKSTGARPVRGLHPRRPAADRHRRRGLGAADDGVGSRRDPARPRWIATAPRSASISR